MCGYLNFKLRYLTTLPSKCQLQRGVKTVVVKKSRCFDTVFQRSYRYFFHRFKNDFIAVRLLWNFHHWLLLDWTFQNVVVRVKSISLWHQFQSFFYYCHIDIDFTKNYILTNFNPKSVSAENFIAIEQGKNHFYSDWKISVWHRMASEKLYRNTLVSEENYRNTLVSEENHETFELYVK